MKKAQYKRKIEILLFCMLLLFAGCQKNGDVPTTTEDQREDLSAEAEGAMTWEEFERAELGEAVVIDGTVKEISSVEEDKISFLAEDISQEDKVYEIENMYCDAQMQEELVAGVKIRVTGYKEGTEEQWSIQNGDVEILSGD